VYPERKTRAWRRWLFASLPPLFLYGGLASAFAHLALMQRKSTGSSDGIPFTVSLPYSADVPVAPRLLVLWLLLSALILAAVFYRWGKDGRPRWKLSSAVVALPWLLNSAHLVMGWRRETLFFLIMTGAGSLETMSAGVGELLMLGSILISGSCLLPAALAAATLLDSSPPRRGCRLWKVKPSHGARESSRSRRSLPPSGCGMPPCSRVLPTL
jgi:hypothetical protein